MPCDVEGTLIYAALTEVPLALIVSWDEERLTLAQQYRPLISSVSNSQVENTQPHQWVHRHFSFAEENAAFSHLASSCVELQRSQIGVEDHVTGLDVDGRLSLPYGAQIPGRVDQTPEGWDCGRGEGGRRRERRKGQR